jgi:hypothetical protein
MPEAKFTTMTRAAEDERAAADGVQPRLATETRTLRKRPGSTQ